MPKGQDWLNFIYVNLGFVAQILIMYIYGQIKEIKENWPKYRCNPVYMPLSDDMSADFTYCIQNMQMDYMGYLLQPLTYLASTLTEMGAAFSESLQYVRNILSNIRSFITSIIESIYGVFLNIIIQFQLIIIKIKDILGKTVGIVLVIMYFIDGIIKSAKSGWNGPPGQMVRAMGSCFHPETKVKLKDGSVVLMQDLKLGDYLENGSRVKATMKVDNSDNKEVLYKLVGSGVDGSDIYVTGSHMICNEDGKYVEVKDYPGAVKQDEVKCVWYSCLVMDDHKIKIRDKHFWDWDDYMFKL